MADALGPPGLRYLGEQRLALGARRTVEVPSAQSGRFLWCETGSLLAVGDGVRGRWNCRLGPGEVLLLCPAEQVWVTSLGDHVAEVRLLQFQAKGEGRTGGLARSVPPVPVRVPGVELALQALAAAGANGAPGSASARESGPAALIRFFHAQAHLYELMAAYLSGAQQRRGPGSLLSYAEEVRRQMTAHCEREYSIEVIARTSGVSPHRFYQAFRLLTGLTPHKYLSALRLRRALRLLAGDFRSVAEVAHAVGYADEFYFSRVFKRELGLAPSAFVRQVQGRPRLDAPAGDLAIFGLSAPEDEPGRPVQCAFPRGGAAGPAGEDGGLPGTSWSRGLRALGQALGLETVADHWVTLMERRLCHLKSLVHNRFPGRPFVVVGVSPHGYRVLGSRHPGLGDLLYIAAGFTPAAGVRGLSEVHARSLAEVTGYGSATALFLVEEGDRSCLAAAWAEAVRGSRAAAATEGPEEVRCLAVPWSGKDDASAYEELAEQLTLLLLEPALAGDTWG